MVGGPGAVIADGRRWGRCHGGTVWTRLTYAVSALRGLRAELPRMDEYYERAVVMAELLAAKGIRTFPEPPHCNAFRMVVEAPGDVVTERVVGAMERERLAVSPLWQDSADVPGWAWTEFTVGAATMEWTIDEAVDLLARILLG